MFYFALASNMYLLNLIAFCKNFVLDHYTICLKHWVYIITMYWGNVQQILNKQ